MAAQMSDKPPGPVVLAVFGMTCGGCASSVTRILAHVPGVTEAQVDLPNGRATVKGAARPDDLIHALEAGGFSGQVL
ncbi:MAG: heavy-metal-associated domain-containing protein [Steroidobacteraceae bacterium]